MNTENELQKMQKRCLKNMCYFIILLGTCLLLIGTQIINFLAPFAKIEPRFSVLLEGFQYGLIVGLMGVATFFIVYYARGVLNSELARKICVKKDDERNKLIKEKAGVRFYLVNCIVLAILAVVCYFNHIAFFTLIGVIYLQIFIMLIMKIYYKYKI